MSVHNSPEVRASLRKAYVIGALRWLIGVAFLFVAFIDFPAHKWTIGLGLLVFNLGVEALIIVMTHGQMWANRVDDVAERKTRQAIMLAAERGSDVGHPWDFWEEVDRRVAAEMGPLPKPAGFWKSTGHVIGAIAWRLVVDVLGIAIVMALTT